jgi:glucan phosphoethanolaminetransferase (alkaline phosphatase superfamily)
MRVPFTELREKESSKKFDEKPRGEGLRKAVGELLTCKFCLSAWVASLLTYGLVLAPRVTRLVAALFSVVTVSDYMHQAYKALMKEASN